MAYRVQFSIAKTTSSTQLQEMGRKIDNLVAPIMEDSLNLVKQYAVQNLSGVAFTSETGTWTIQKRTGKGAASVQVQYPYGSPFKGRVFAYATSQYPGNPEQWNYLKILEEGRGEIKPKYTPSMRDGKPQRAALAIPGGSFNLASGMNGFRGVTGRYRFVKRIPPMEGRFWLKSAMAQAQPEFKDIVSEHLNPSTT